MKECYVGTTFKRKLKIQMTFISEFCPKIMKLIDELEGTSYPIAHLLWNKLEDLKSSLERQRQGYFDEKTSLSLKDYEGIDKTMKTILKSARDKSSLLQHIQCRRNRPENNV